MKDFPFWRGAIYKAKTPLVLKAVGEELAQFQKQTGFLDDDVMKLTVVQMAILRKQYAEKLKKLTSETIDLKDRPKPKLNKNHFEFP